MRLHDKVLVAKISDAVYARAVDLRTAAFSVDVDLVELWASASVAKMALDVLVPFLDELLTQERAEQERKKGERIVQEKKPDAGT